MNNSTTYIQVTRFKAILSLELKVRTTKYTCYQVRIKAKNNIHKCYHRTINAVDVLADHYKL